MASSALQDLFTIAYEELRRIARARMAHERSCHTLQPTELVHEAYLRLIDQQMHFENRGHFFSAAAEAMRRILIDHARKLNAQKRNAQLQRIELNEAMLAQKATNDQHEALSEAVTRLHKLDRQMSDVLKLRFFVSLTIHETAEALSIAPRTVDRQWAAARLWLTREIRKK